MFVLAGVRALLGLIFSILVHCQRLFLRIVPAATHHSRRQADFQQFHGDRCPVRRPLLFSLFADTSRAVNRKIKVLYAKWKMKRMYGSIVENEQWKRDFYECEDFGGLFGEYLEMG